MQLQYPLFARVAAHFARPNLSGRGLCERLRGLGLQRITSARIFGFRSFACVHWQLHVLSL